MILFVVGNAMVAGLSYCIAPGSFEFAKFISVFAGVTLTSSCAITLNQWIEATYDAQMDRTQARPAVMQRVR